MSKLKISGIQKTSLIEYPGEIVTTIFTQGCNLRCPYCHNPELISKDSEYYLDINKIKEFIKERSDYIDGVSITGGEPLCQDTSALFKFIIWVKSLGLKVKLDTNGTEPLILIAAINQGLLDYVALDIKMPLGRYEELGYPKHAAINVDVSIEKLICEDIDYEFRTTVVPGMHTKDDIAQIASLISLTDKTYYIQNFRGHKTLNKDLLNTPGFSEDDLEDFQNIASKYVNHVKVRY